MRLIIILIAVLLVGLLVYKQIGPGAVQPSETVNALSSPDAPQVPTAPQQVKEIGVQMNQHMNEEAEKRAAAIKKATSQ